jgi:hypothetical protein
MNMSTLPVERISDRRIFPDRRQYSYTCHIPERRLNDRHRKNEKSSSVASFQKGVEPMVKELLSCHKQIGKQHRLPVRHVRRRYRTPTAIVLSERKRHLIEKIEKAVRKKGKSKFTKEELIQMLGDW